MRLYLGNLSWQATEGELEAAFTPYGVRAGSIRIIRDHATNKSKGFGFIEVQEGQQALQDMQNFEIAGRPLRLQEATRVKK